MAGTFWAPTILRNLQITILDFGEHFPCRARTVVKMPQTVKWDIVRKLMRHPCFAHGRKPPKKMGGVLSAVQGKFLFLFYNKTSRRQRRSYQRVNFATSLASDSFPAEVGRKALSPLGRVIAGQGLSFV